MKTPIIFNLGEHAVLLRWRDINAEKTLEEINVMQKGLANTFSNEILEMVPSYTELAIYFKSAITTTRRKEILTYAFQTLKNSVTKKLSRRITIPVCYEGEVAIDLAEVASYHKISVEEVIRRHSQAIYTVAFIGFLPGFPYLTGLPETLVTPRKTTPRGYVASGSVGIGASQTGVYTQASPGGWNIIGKSPLRFFSSEEDPPSLLQAGDIIKFSPISKQEYDLIELQVKSAIYKPEIETI